MHARRLRWQTRLVVPLNHHSVIDKTWFVDAWDELFLMFGPEVKNIKTLNQNRFVFLLGRRFNGDAFPVKIEGGITYQTLLQYNMSSPPGNPSVTYNNSNIENNTAFTLYVIFDEFDHLFRKPVHTARAEK